MVYYSARDRSWGESQAADWNGHRVRSHSGEGDNPAASCRPNEATRAAEMGSLKEIVIWIEE